MALLSIKVSIPEHGITKTMQFDRSTKAKDACKIIRDKMQEVPLGPEKDYGLFLSDEDQKKGVWLEMDRMLEYYLLRNGDLLVYKRRMRTLKVKMLDGSVKTVLVDDSQPVSNLMVVICTKIGITNHDEYSLVREMPEEVKEVSTGTLTLRRDKKDKNSKMEQLKKKLKTDDDLNWVDHSKTLREQGIDEEENLLLRRKYFFSDHNVDSRDPVQLNLLYVQARDAILNGAHPVTVSQACQFGGIQCQIQFGDHVESKHKPGFLDLKEFLPKDFYKTKGIEKKVYVEHKKYKGLSEIEAKVQYVSLARSLKTYGVTFFLVKEKMKNKNKLVPRLLGVTKDSVLRLDEKTKEILQTWPLTTVRRWAASPNSFTLDFGDYSESYYSVQTTEGEQISQLIAGYIDIIIKKQRSKDHLGIEGDEGSTMVEDNVSPAKATILQQNPGARLSQISTGSIAMPAVMRVGANGAQPFGLGQVQPVQYGDVKNQAHSVFAPVTPQQTRVQSTNLTEPQKAFLSCIDSGHDAIETAQRELESQVELPAELTADPGALQWKQNTLDVKRQTVSSQIAAMNAATAQVITYTSVPPEEMDHPAVGAAISTIATNLPEMSKDVKMIAALMDDASNGERLLDAARNLCSAFSDLLRAAEPERQEPRQSLLAAAGKVGEASHAVLYTIGEEEEADREVQDALVGESKAVANATANLILKAKNVASKCAIPEQQSSQSDIIHAATQCALATSQLLACAKVVSPTISNDTCKQQFLEAAKEVGRAVEGVVSTCEESGVPDEKKEVQKAAEQVSNALQTLIDHISHIPDQKRAASPEKSLQEDAVEKILATSGRIAAVAPTRDSAEMVRQAKVLAKATSELINAIQGEAEKLDDDDARNRILSAAKLLADATSRMIEAAKGCASNPQDVEYQTALCRAVEEIKHATSAAAAQALKRKLIRNLEAAAKEACGVATQNIAAAKGASAHNSSESSHQELLDSCKEVASIIPKVIQGVKATMADCDDPAAQMSLIKACMAMVEPCHQMIQASNSSLATVNDQASALQLANTCKNMDHSLKALEDALGKVYEACGTLELEHALDAISKMEQELEKYKALLEKNELKPTPEETAETAAAKLAAACKAVGASMAQLLTAVTQGSESYTGQAARETTENLDGFVDAVRGVAATTEKEAAKEVIAQAQEVLTRSRDLIAASQQALQNPGDPAANQAQLAHVARQVSSALTATVNSLPTQRKIDEVINTINESSQVLNSSEFPASEKPYTELQSNLSDAAADLNTTAGRVVEDAPTNRLAGTAQKFGDSYGHLLGCGVEMIGATKNREVQGQMVVSLRNVSIVSSKLLAAAKLTSSDPSAPNMRLQLTDAARAVSDSINHLVDVCTTAAPTTGQRECDNAIRSIQSMRPLLDNPCEPLSNANYFECLDSVLENSKILGDALANLTNHAKSGDGESLAHAVKIMADSICYLIESGAQAAYLVGIADPSSIAGRPGLVDPRQIAHAIQAIQAACQQLVSPNTLQPQIMSAATVIAKHTSGLCNSCRVASSRTTNSVAKCNFIQSAKDVANATAKLVKEIKALDQDPSESTRKSFEAATKPFFEAIDNFANYANSPEFATIPAKLSEKAKQEQVPILDACRKIIDGSCSMIATAKELLDDPRDPLRWKTLSESSKAVSDAIISLVAALKDHSPGQKECERAIQKLGQAMQLLSQVPLYQNGAHPTEKNLRDQVESLASDFLKQIDPIAKAAKSEPENLSSSVNRIANLSEPLARSAVSCAAAIPDSETQAKILDHTKNILESALRLVYVAKETGGNPRSSHLHGEIDEAARSTKNGVKDLKASLELLDSMSQHLDSLNQALAKLDLKPVTSHQEEKSYADYEALMVAAAKEIAKLSQEMASKSSDPSQVDTLARNVFDQYSHLAACVPGCLATSSNNELADRIKDSTKELGVACQDILKAATRHLTSPSPYTLQAMADASWNVSEKVSQVLSALSAGSRGLQACDNASSTVSGIIGDLDTTILFATAGTLHPDSDQDSFEVHRGLILETAKSLVDDMRALVSGATSNQAQLAVAAQSSVSTILQLAEVVKIGAASLGSSNTQSQVLLINAVKDVASALGDLLQSAKTTSSTASSSHVHHLEECAKMSITSITSLLMTVRAVEDEHARGTRALESTIEAINQEIRAYDGPYRDPPRSVTPEELVRATKPVTLATAKTVAAGNSGKQDDAIMAANMARKAVTDLLLTCKAALATVEEPLRTPLYQAGRECALYYHDLLQQILSVIQKPSLDAKQKLVGFSRDIAQSLAEIVNIAQAMKGSDYVDPDDPTVIAESELLFAANSIDAAAKKLASFKPRPTIKETTTDETQNFDEMILEAAKAITAATSALVKAASAAQKDLVLAGKVGATTTCLYDDSQWSEGLVSAARLVAAATHSLVEAANELVQGQGGSREKLISAARQVAASTAQLLVACQVKADPGSISMKRLQAAGNAVKKATDNLVHSAQRVLSTEHVEQEIEVSSRMVGGIRQEIVAREEVLRKEKELQEAQNKLKLIRQAKYRNHNERLSPTTSE